MIEGIIFDMDGVISDTQKLHARVESTLLKKFGVLLSPSEITEKYAGVRTKDFFQELLEKSKVPYDIDALMQEKWQEMEKLAHHSVEPVAGSQELIKEFFSEGCPLAVASASNDNYVRAVLMKLHISKYFKAIVSGDMVSKGKPNPEIFLRAASLLNIKAENCLVIEDGMSGMEAAAQAGMYCIGLVPRRSKQYPTQYQVQSLSEINANYLEKMMHG